jgi:hypothetical protein
MQDIHRDAKVVDPGPPEADARAPPSDYDGIDAPAPED